MKGTKNIQTNIPIVKRITEGCTVKKIQVVHVIRLILKRFFKGVGPKPFLETYRPPKIKLKFKNPNIKPHVWTVTKVNPYASINAIKTPPRKLLNVVKNIKAKSPGTALTAFIVPLRSTFFWPAGCSSWCV